MNSTFAGLKKKKKDQVVEDIHYDKGVNSHFARDFLAGASRLSGLTACKWQRSMCCNRSAAEGILINLVLS